MIANYVIAEMRDILNDQFLYGDDPAQVMNIALRLLDAVEAVLAPHHVLPGSIDVLKDEPQGWCAECAGIWPCPTVQAVETALGVTL